MTKPPDIKRFGELLTQYRSRLYAFILSVVGNPEFAMEVFQESNLVLWRKAAEFDHERDFLPWAFAVARNQVLAGLKRRGRDRLVFDEPAIERLTAAAEQRAQQTDQRQIALTGCLEKLPADQRQLVERRYRAGESVQEIAADTQRTSGATGVLLFRIRQTLAHCISGRLEVMS